MHENYYVLNNKIFHINIFHRVISEDPDPHLHFECRGPVTMKGKREPMVTYLLTSNDDVTQSKES